MKLILAATNRPSALTLKVAQHVQSIYQKQGESVDLLDLKEVPLKDIVECPYKKDPPQSIKPYLDQVAQAEALIVVCPEYNGGPPGLIKHFIDHWHYPESFVHKPVCFVGLGGKFGALRPIEQLQNIFLYRHSFVFPLRVFIQNIETLLKEGSLKDTHTNRLLEKQAQNFTSFVKALNSATFSK